MASNFAQSKELFAPGAVGAICSFIGSFTGKRVVHKVTLLIGVWLLASLLKSRLHR